MSQLQTTDTKPARRAKRSTAKKAKAETPETIETDAPVIDDMGEELGPENVKRIPMGSRQARLAAAKRPGFYSRWINAVHGRVERAKAAGFVHRMGDDGKPIQAPAGRAEEGGGLTAYLMDLPEKFRKEDLAAKDQVVRGIDEAIDRGKLKGQEGDKSYVPEQGIKIKHQHTEHAG